MSRFKPSGGPSLQDFLFRSQVKTLYRKLVKTAYKIPDLQTRTETISFYKDEFKKLTDPKESKTHFSFLRNSVVSLAEMLNRSGVSKF